MIILLFTLIFILETECEQLINAIFGHNSECTYRPIYNIVFINPW